MSDDERRVAVRLARERLTERTAAAQGDHHFFSPATMRWFHSRLLDVVWVSADQALFITSDRPFSELPRAYQVSVATFSTSPEGRERVRIARVEERIATLGRARTALRHQVEQRRAFYLNTAEEGD